MLADRIEAKWIDAFCEVFERCAVKSGDTAAILSETQSRALNVHLAELALLRMGARPFHVVVPTPRNRQIVPIRSTGASEAIQQLGPVVTALQQAGFVVDCTIEGLMHAPETPDILKAGARILVISNEHPEALERMVPDTALEKRVRAAAKMLRGTKRMRVTSKAGTALDVDMVGASTVGVWGWTFANLGAFEAPLAPRNHWEVQPSTNAVPPPAPQDTPRRLDLDQDSHEVSPS